MNANKQDAGGEVTNPDNVGGLLPCPGCGKSDLDHCPADFIAVNGLTRGMIVRCAWCHFAAPEAAWNRREPCRAAPAGGAPESLVKWERDYDDTHLAPYCREDVKRLLADWRASIAAPAGGDDLYRQACDSVEEWKARALEAEADIARIHAQINAENGPTFMGEPVVSAPAGGRPYGGDPAEPRDDSDRYDSAPAGSGEVDGWLLDGCLIYRLSDGRNQTNTHEINVTMWDGSRELAVRDKAAAALLRKLQQGADYVMVPRDSAKMVTHVCSEWIDLFRDAPGIEKYERYSYEPAVEELRDEYAAIAASQGQEGGK